MKHVYLDYAATTPLDSRVLKVMEPFFEKDYGNPSSIHAEGVAAKKAVDEARVKVARSLEAHADEIVFTGGGTEANNLAIFGVIDSASSSAPFQRGSAESSRRRGFNTPPNPPSKEGGRKMRPHVVMTNIEHASVMEPLRELERQGRAEVTYVPVEPNGIVEPEKVIAAIRPNTVLVSVMHANNEIGTIQPIAKIGKEIRNLRNGLKHQIPSTKSQTNPKFKTQNLKTPIFHVDGCQAPLYLHCLVNALGVDLLTLDGHKMYGPKGVGALYVRRGTPLSPLIFGGGQERGLRSATENVPAIVGFAAALRIAVSEREKESTRIAKLRDHLCADILKNISTTIVNGSMEKGERLPNNLNISLPGIDTEFLTLQLDAVGIAVSTKSSCLKNEKESYVVAALGEAKPDSSNPVARSAGSGFREKDRARSTLRFTLGRHTTKKEIQYAAETLGTLLNSKH